jgi:hypothetical protein
LGRPRPRAAVAVVAAALGGLAIAQTAEPPLRAMRWAPADADPLRAFGQAPAECLKPPAEPALAQKVEIGRAAFRTPVVLGGQAARAGLSCESCHRSGRGNPDFLFPGVSGAPGTADVTSSLFSSHRGNGAFDPRPIPDLGGPKSALKVKPEALRSFIHGLVVEEFDGPEPPAAVLDGLVAYVRAMDPAYCAGNEGPVTLAGLMADYSRALAAADAALAGGDRPTAVLMVAAARARLALAHERFEDADVRLRIVAEDQLLAELQDRLRGGRRDAAGRLAERRKRAGALEAALARYEPASLFDPDRLAEAAKRRLRAGPS